MNDKNILFYPYINFRECIICHNVLKNMNIYLILPRYYKYRHMLMMEISDRV